MQAERFMKTFIPLQLLAVFTLAPVPSAQEVITAALAGVPMTDEPDHHLVLNNDYVNAYDVEVPPHGSTRLHQHLHDNVFIVFGNAEVTNAVEGKTPVHLDLKDSSVNFGRAPYAHKVTNNGTLPFRNIIIELLQSRGDAEKFYSSVDEALASAAGDASGIKQNAVLKTDNVRVIAVAVPVGGVWSAPNDDRDRLVVLFDEINDTANPKEKNTSFPKGMLVWFGDNKETGPLTNQLDHLMRLMVLEFRNTSQENPDRDQTSSPVGAQYCSSTLQSTTSSFTLPPKFQPDKQNN